MRGIKNNFHAKSIEKILKKLKSSKKGLSKQEAEKRLKKFGFNEVSEKKKVNPFFIFLKQFNSFLVYILAAAALISFFIKHYVDFYVILFVILVNAIIGFSQEYRAEKSIRALKKMVVTYAKVYRDEELLKIPAKEVVPGDILFLEEGDKIPADARLLELKNFQTMESSLTGESFPVGKKLGVLPEKISLGDKKNCVFMGTFVASGNCKAVVVGTGSKTEIGKIAKDIESIKKVKSHFREKSDFLAKQMSLIAVAGALIAFLIGYFIRGFNFVDIFMFMIASLVSGIPEGLLAVLTIVLAVGAYRMSKKNAIIRNLPATETLGIVNTIITDKTGTLTENTMNIEKVILPGQSSVKISGSGWSPNGDFFQEDKKINPHENLQLLKFLEISGLCNNAKILKEKGKYGILGDPTEAAFVVLSEKAGLRKSTLEKKQKKIDDLPFNPEFKYRASLSTLVENKNKKQIYVIGAPESVLEHSKYFLEDGKERELGNSEKRNFLSGIDSLTSKSMRVLAIAYKDASHNVDNLSEEIVNELIFVGFAGIRDPPRKGIKESIEKARQAGIRVIMVTGDHKGTALSIAKEIGLVKGKNPKAYTENDLRSFSKEGFSKIICKENVFARLTPNMKLKIAAELQNQGQVIAMTGDGVNDAPALKKADVGISMGVVGTDVARESSEIILSDDNFVSIVDAIEEGRIVFTNTRQASGFLVATNFAEDATIIASLIFFPYLILLPTQILWLNLVTDGVTDVALALEKGHDDVLDEPPRNSKENILSKEILPFLIFISVIMVFATIFVFNYFLGEGLDKARTGAFVVMSFTQLFNVFNMRSLKSSVFKIGIFSNKFLSLAVGVSFLLTLGVVYLPLGQGIFGFVDLGFIEFVSIFLISSLVFIFGEGYKFVRGRYKN